MNPSPRLVPLVVFAMLSEALGALPAPAMADDFAALQSQYESSQQAVLKKFCLGCHSTVEQQGDLDLERFRSVADIRTNVVPWQRAVELIDDREMPPKEAEHQLSPEERAALRSWIQAVLDADARANAGDPGPVVLRRLNNAEFTYTIQDLTGLSLQPAKEFPVDSAAGEGFTNVGNALVISPALIQKYLDAGKDVASHAMLLSHGMEWSEHTTPRDWTDEKLNAIRSFYARYTDNGGSTSVNLQGIQFETNGGGRLPIDRYLRATLVERDALRSGQRSLSDVAKDHGLNEKYLRTLWTALTDSKPSLLLDGLRTQWNQSGPDDVPALMGRIQPWQQALWRFTTVGHIGKRDGPKAWQVSIDPIAARQEIRMTIPPTEPGRDLTLYLVNSDAGDGNEHDFAVWENARFTAPGQPDLLLRDVRAAVAGLHAYRDQVKSTIAASLQATAEVMQTPEGSEAPDIDMLAQRHQVDPAILASWFSYLGVGSGEAVIEGHMTSKMESLESYDFVKGWVGADALSFIANSSDNFVRVPGDLKAHSVAVHPAPTIRVITGWRSPVDGTMTISGRVQRAHMGCGNGVTWLLELRRGRTRIRLASGVAGGPEEAILGPFENTVVKRGDVLSLVIGPRDGNHSCDLTAIDLTIRGEQGTWNLADDVSPDLLAGNPHADRMGNPSVWHFSSEPENATGTDSIIPAGSLMAQWQSASTGEERGRLADALQQLVRNGPGDLPADAPDAVLYRQLTALNGPLFSAVRREILSRATSADAVLQESAAAYGLDPSVFGKHPDGSSISPTDLCVKAPGVMEIVVPADLVAGCDFVATGSLHQPTGNDGSVQLLVSTTKPAALNEPQAGASRVTGGKSTWSDGEQPVAHDAPILVTETGTARARLLAQFEEFRQLFPAALCYTRIVPVDEVVTLTLYYREDDHLKRLMLNEAESAELDRLWDDMHYVSRSALALVDAYEQLWQYATQDADPSAFTPMKDGIMKSAEEFREKMKRAEPIHVQSVIQFAEKAWRRPLTDEDRAALNQLYVRLREEELDHESAVRMMIARVLVAPPFLYRGEEAQPGRQPTAVSDWELATRLSYFLWSSVPDEALREAAASGRLREKDSLQAELRRMLKDPKMRRMAIEFGCQWLHVRDFDQLDEKSEQHYPEFTQLRSDMYEETIQFFDDMFRNDGSVLDLVNADHVFVNGRLAAFYGIPGVEGDEWRRVDNARTFSRGGILTFGTTLAKQSGASRTSPILRGNWISEFLLGDKLPKPPKGVPLLPEEAPADVTERQLIETHSTDPACAKCHQRIDPFGFALEKFDTIGRLRDRDRNDHVIDTATVLPDGTPVNGLEGLRDYLLNARREDFVRTFCRRLLGYSLGRSTQLSDEPLIQQMMNDLNRSDYRISAAMEVIVLSPQFRQIRGADQNPGLAQQEE